MKMVECPRKKRALLLKHMLAKKYSAEQIIIVLREINERPEEEREAEAERILAEME